MLGKRIINTATGAAPSACTTDTVQILGDTSCIAYYKMSDATDETGSYDGTPTDVNFNVAGKFGNAGEFNGSSSKVDLPNLGLGGNATRSVSIWVNPATTPSTLGTLYHSGGTNAKESFNIYYQSDNKIRVEYDNRSITTSTIISNNTWTHIVATYNGGSIELSANTNIYINGVLQTVTNSGGATGVANTLNSDYAIGYRRYANSFYFDGKIDQVRIFNRAITANEVTTLYDEVQCIPTIVPSEHFNTVTYTANGAVTPITGVGFQPDFTWIKGRTLGSNHQLTDSVRNAPNCLGTNGTGAETTRGVQSFDSDGFTLQVWPNENGDSNTSGDDYVAWNFKAGGAAVSNTDGTITSQVSANVDAGFSIVKYTGNGTSGATVGTGLSSAAELIIVKNTDDTDKWAVYSSAIGATKFLSLNETAAATTSSAYWNNTEPTSSVFTIGATSPVNSPNTEDYIAYCFHSVDGFSKFGSYTGTGASGNSIVTGFEPAFLMVKRIDSGDNWLVFDNKRNTTNPTNLSLIPNSSAAESVGNLGNGFSFLSNGFEVVSTDSGVNANGGSYIFMAFAEEVFNPNGVTRNATNPFGDASELALYKFEDNANDAEGSYNGTASNVTYATGYIDKAAVFNGSSSHIIAPSFMPTGSSSRSVSAWVKTTVSTANMTILFYGAESNNNAFIFRVINGQLGVAFWANDHNFTATGLTDGNWHHVVATYDGSLAKLYLDGDLIGTGSAGAVSTSSANLAIGAYNNGTDALFNGSIDQVRIFNRALDSGEVTQLYNE